MKEREQPTPQEEPHHEVTPSGGRPRDPDAPEPMPMPPPPADPAGLAREVGDLEDPDAEDDGALPGRVGGGLAGG